MDTVLQLSILFISTLLLTHLVVQSFRHRSWLEIPNSRSSHETPVPRSGGVAFAGVFLCFSIFLYLTDFISGRLLLLIGTGLPLALMGLLDDIHHLGIGPRISTQVLSAFAMLLLLGGLPPLPFPGELQLDTAYFGYLLGVVCIVWLINLYNFMDGIDGLAALEACFACMAAAWFAKRGGFDPGLVLALGLFSCCAGFVVLNLPPARIFMGDVGSNFLGGMLAVLALLCSWQGVTTLWTWVILLAVFITDSSLTLLRRVWQGEVWYHAHRSHAYQRAARLCASHGKIGLAVCCLNLIWLFPLAWWSVVYPGAGLYLSLLAYLPLLLLYWYVGRVWIRRNTLTE